MSSLTATHLLDAMDPVRLMRVAGYPPFPYQASFLRSRSRQILVCMGRQAGKSRMVGGRIAHFALSRPGRLVLIGCAEQGQSVELMAKVSEILSARLNREALLKNTTKEKVLPNSSRIVALPGNARASRRWTAHMVVLEEAAFIPDPVYDTITATLATTNGPLIAITTAPETAGGWFWRAWTQDGQVPGEEAAEKLRGVDGWERWYLPSSASPLVSQEFLDSERTKKTEQAFNREYLCRFPAAVGDAKNPLITPDFAQFLEESFKAETVAA